MLVPARLTLPDILPDGARAARVTRVDRTGYDVLTEDGPLRVPALPRPRDTDGADVPTVGDWLALSGDVPVALLPRSGLVARRATGTRSTVQPLAANVDVVLLCAGLHVDLPVRRLERLLTLAWDSGAQPVVVLTQADRCDDVDAAVRRAARHAPGVEVVAVAAATGDVSALDP